MRRIMITSIALTIIGAIMFTASLFPNKKTIEKPTIESTIEHDIEKELGGADIDGWFYADPEEYETEEELKERLEPEVEEEDSNIAEYLDTDIQRNATPYIKDNNKLNMPYDNFQYNN